MAGFDFRKGFFSFIYDFLNVGQAPENGDCIFVFAGRPQRKYYALNLWKSGYAKRIIFSVGRYEWRSFFQLGIEDDGGLAVLVQQTPPRRRHFFVCMTNKETKSFLINRRKLGTMSEVIALADYIQKEDIRNLIIVSSAFHLRRTTETLRRFCPDSTLRIIPVAVPDELLPDTRRKWWAMKKSSSLILSEYIKYISYKFFLPLFYNGSPRA